MISSEEKSFLHMLDESGGQDEKVKVIHKWCYPKSGERGQKKAGFGVMKD